MQGQRILLCMLLSINCCCLGLKSGRKLASSIPHLQMQAEMRIDHGNRSLDALGGHQWPKSRQPLGSGQNLDIVIAHYDSWNLEWHVRPFWEQFINLPKIKDLNPYVYFYCQNPEMGDKELTDMLTPLLRRGEIIRMDNIGREGRVYLHHIVKHYDRLAQHTIFSQDVATHWGEEQKYDLSIPRISALFKPNTGILALFEVRKETCNDTEWADSSGVPTTLMYQTYSMLTGKLCPPEGFVTFYKGQFVASKRRIRSRPRALYKEMLDTIEAPEDHWIHNRMNNSYYNTSVNPWIGHVYERSWSLVFRCSDPNSDMVELCKACDVSKWQSCEPQACQCLDPTANQASSVPGAKASIQVRMP